MQTEDLNKTGSYGNLLWKQFRKRKAALWSLRLVLLVFIIAIFADFLASDKPIYCSYKGETYFPVMHDYLVKCRISNPQTIDWKHIHPSFAIWPVVRYAATSIDLDNAQFVSPSALQHIPSPAFKHYLGTDAIGKDILSGMIHGTRIALAVGILSMLIASLIGIILGALAGFFGDFGCSISRASVLSFCIFLPIAFFYAFQCRAFVLQDAMNESFASWMVEFAISLFIFLLFGIPAYLLSRLFIKFSYFSKKIHIPLDIIISRFIEIFTTIPKLFLLFSLVIIIKPSLLLLITVIGLLSWTEIAVFIRAEMLRIRNMEYIESGRALGIPPWKLILRHALPNALPPVLITISFGIAAAILTESSLSFLGIGLPIETLSWGKILSSAREAPQAWWLAVFPGMAIFLTVTAFNLIGEGISEAMDSRSELK